jgi:Zn-dependent protease/predicted transcriptional regulator
LSRFCPCWLSPSRQAFILEAAATLAEMTGTIKVGEFFGIPVRLHYTWFVALVLVMLALAVYFWGMYSIWHNLAFGAAASVLFFVSMCLRELVCLVTASRLHVPVRGITLFVFAGMPRIADEDFKPLPELGLAIVAVLANLAIAGLFYAIYGALINAGALAAAELMQWLFYFNVMAALFNLLPAPPLAAGRALQAILRLALRNHSRAARITTLLGRSIAILLVVTGIAILFVSRDIFAGIAIAVAGWFLENAASASRRQALVRDAFRGITAHDMMTEDYTPIKQQLTFGLVRDYIINSGQNCFFVIEDGKLEGIVTLTDILIPQKRWNSTKISDIMTPAKKLKTAPPSEPAVNLLELMDDYGINQVPIIRGETPIGMVTRERLLRFLKARAVLRAF